MSDDKRTSAPVDTVRAAARNLTAFIIETKGRSHFSRRVALLKTCLKPSVQDDLRDALLQTAYDVTMNLPRDELEKASQGYRLFIALGDDITTPGSDQESYLQAAERLRDVHKNNPYISP